MPSVTWTASTLKTLKQDLAEAASPPREPTRHPGEPSRHSKEPSRRPKEPSSHPSVMPSRHHRRSSHA